MSTETEIRVLLAEDHALFRQGLRELLTTAGLAVVGEASDGMTAVRLARELRPDVVVMDLHMPRMDGIDATSEIMKAERPPVVLVLTVSTTSDDVLDAIAAGAAGYLLKDADAAEIVNGVRSASAGRSPLSPTIAGALVRRVRERGLTTEQPEDLLALTARETEILRLVAQGRDNTEIAQELYLEPEHRQEPRVEHPREAGRRQPGPGGGAGCARRDRLAALEAAAPRLGRRLVLRVVDGRAQFLDELLEMRELDDQLVTAECECRRLACGIGIIGAVDCGRGHAALDPQALRLEREDGRTPVGVEVVDLPLGRR